jgi:hypothetical protein
MDDAYSVQTTALDSGLEMGEPEPVEQLQALKSGNAFLVADAWGDVKSGADGLFDEDTRILSRLMLRVGGQRPSRLTSGVSQDNVFFTFHGTNRPCRPWAESRRRAASCIWSGGASCGTDACSNASASPTTVART